MHSDEVDDVIDEVVEVEAAHGQRHVARVDPVGDVEIVLRQHRLDGAAQQRRVVARHRRDQQHLRVVALAPAMARRARSAASSQNGVAATTLFAHRHVEAVDARRLDPELRLAVAPRHVLEHFAGRREMPAEGRHAQRVERPIQGRAHAPASRP